MVRCLAGAILVATTSRPVTVVTAAAAHVMANRRRQLPPQLEVGSREMCVCMYSCTYSLIAVCVAGIKRSLTLTDNIISVVRVCWKRVWAGGGFTSRNNKQ